MTNPAHNKIISLDRVTAGTPDPNETELINELSLYTNYTTWKKEVGWHYNSPLDPEDLDDNTWLPAAYAAMLAGVSKQAISDRIKRGTLECRERQQSSFWEGDGKGAHVKLVRWGDVKKKRKAGRPKGSRNKSTARERNCSNCFYGTQINKQQVQCRKKYAATNGLIKNNCSKCDEHRFDAKEIALEKAEGYFCRDCDHYQDITAQEGNCPFSDKIIKYCDPACIQLKKRADNYTDVLKLQKQLELNYTDANGIEVKGIDLEPESFEKFKAYWLEIGGPEGKAHWRDLVNEFEPNGDQFKWMAIMDKIIDSIN
jgi:hypothetical protein